jgi:hypothetical protein
MATINIESPLGLTQIEIVKNSFTDKFVPQIKSMFGEFPSKSFMVTYGGIMRKIPLNFVETQTQRLADAIDGLNKLGTNFPYPLRADLLELRNTETQLYLNDLHRAFTTAHRYYYDGPPYRWNDRFDSEFKLDVANDGEKFLYLIDQINDAVHAMELHVKTDRNSTITTNLAQQVEVGADTYVNNGTRLIKECFFNIAPEDYQYFSDSDEFDVWVGTSILGKDYLIAYYQHDDAGEWDITHMLGYSCKIAVDVSEIKRSTVIKSTEFRQWLAQGGVNYSPAICGMPIGRVVAGKEFLAQYLKGSPVTDQLRITVNE